MPLGIQTITPSDEDEDEESRRTGKTWHRLRDRQVQDAQPLGRVVDDDDPIALEGGHAAPAIATEVGGFPHHCYSFGRGSSKSSQLNPGIRHPQTSTSDANHREKGMPPPPESQASKKAASMVGVLNRSSSPVGLKNLLGSIRKVKKVAASKTATAKVVRQNKKTPAAKDKAQASTEQIKSSTARKAQKSAAKTTASFTTRTTLSGHIQKRPLGQLRKIDLQKSEGRIAAASEDAANSSNQRLQVKSPEPGAYCFEGMMQGLLEENDSTFVAENVSDFESTGPKETFVNSDPNAAVPLPSGNIGLTSQAEQGQRYPASSELEALLWSILCARSADERLRERFHDLDSPILNQATLLGLERLRQAVPHGHSRPPLHSHRLFPACVVKANSTTWRGRFKNNNPFLPVRYVPGPASRLRRKILKRDAEFESEQEEEDATQVEECGPCDWQFCVSGCSIMASSLGDTG